VVNGVNAIIPAWFMTGLKTAGAILPAMGMAILMRYLPIKKYYPYFIIGFVLIAFGGATFTVMAAALIGLALAALHLSRARERAAVQTLDEEEVEIDG